MVKFIVDAMLGDVARWLRLLGYDTLYASNVDDREILEKARKENRVIVTRDTGLYWRARKLGIRAVLLRNTGSSVVDKLVVLIRKTGIELPERIDPSKSRCPLCNGELVPVEDKSLISGRVPPKVLSAYDRFWVCKSCGKVYWLGSHWKNIYLQLESLRKKLYEKRTARS